jgi:hypothetical protein
MMMTKPKTPEPVDPKLAFIEVFKRTGGIAGMTSWAKTHRTLFYSLFGKLISQPLVQTNITATVKVESEDQLRASLEHALHRIIDARAGEQASVIIDARANRNAVGEPQTGTAARRLPRRLPRLTTLFRCAAFDPPTTQAAPPSPVSRRESRLMAPMMG